MSKVRQMRKELKSIKSTLPSLYRRSVVLPNTMLERDQLAVHVMNLIEKLKKEGAIVQNENSQRWMDITTTEENHKILQSYVASITPRYPR